MQARSRRFTLCNANLGSRDFDVVNQFLTDIGAYRIISMVNGPDSYQVTIYYWDTEPDDIEPRTATDLYIGDTVENKAGEKGELVAVTASGTGCVVYHWNGLGHPRRVVYTVEELRKS